MAFNNSFTAVTGATFTAAQFNTHVRDNFTAIWVGTTAGDIDYYTSATAKNRVAIGGAGAILKSDGSAPGWLSIGSAGNMLYTNAAGNAPAWGPGTRFFPSNLNADVALATGDFQGWFMVPPDFNGWRFYGVYAMRNGGTGTLTLQLRRAYRGGSADNTDILSTKLTVDSGEITSGTAATPAVVNASHIAVQSYDVFAWDVDVSGTNSFNVVAMAALAANG